MKTTLKFTHYGWFGLCPVYISDPEGPAPILEPRHWVLTFLFMLSEGIFHTINFVNSVVCALAGARYHGGYSLVISGELERPYQVEVDVDD